MEKHYADLKDKKFFPGLIEYMSSGPVIAMVWEGDNAVSSGRVMLGATRPFDSLPGTIRGDFCIDVGRNIIHGSDSVESANKEIALWFKPEQLVDWSHHSHNWTYESPAQPKQRVSSFKPETLEDFEKQFPLYKYDLTDMLDLLKLAIKVRKGKPDLLTVKSLADTCKKTDAVKYANLIDELEISTSQLRKFLN